MSSAKRAALKKRFENKRQNVVEYLQLSAFICVLSGSTGRHQQQQQEPGKER